MNNINVLLDNLETTILQLGRVGENEHTQIRINCISIFSDYPNATVAMTVQPPQGEAYPKVITRSGVMVSWVVLDSDLVADGSGQIQLTFTNDNEIIKTVIGNTQIFPSLEPTGDVPTPIENWIDTANETLAEFQTDVTDIRRITTAEASDEGKVLSAKTVTDGKVTEWDYVDVADPDVITQAVDDWLDDHPEATTTVQDGAITEPKLNDSLKSALAWQSDVDGLMSAIDDLSDDTIHLVSGKNKFNKNDPNVVSGACIISDGSVLQNSYTTSYYATGYIPVSPVTRYLWTDYNIGSTMALAFYNSEKTCIGYIAGGGADGLVATNGKFTTIANTAYIRTTGTTANINSAMLVVGTIAGDYEPFKKVNPINDNLINGNHVKVAPVFRVKSADLSSNLTMAVPNLKQKIFTFTANCSTVGTLTIANGLRLAYKSGWILITSTKLIVRSYRYTGSTTGEMTELEVTHSLDLTGFMSVTLKHNANKTAEIILCGKSGKVFRTGFYFEGCADDLTVYNYQGTYSNCTLTMWCEHFKKDVWAYGDSYFDMWPLKAIPMGATNVMFDAYTGRNSAQALASLSLDFEKCLPKKVLWCMGMNDPDADSTVNASWKSAFDSVKALCDNYGIEFIGCTIPNTPTMENSYKNAYIKSSGVRYVDVAEAVGASESGASWYTGMLSTDNVHPTDLGREIIAGAVIAGVPEIMTDEVVTST